MATPSQRPLELIHARNLLSSVSTAAMLVNSPGDIIFYNEAAAALLGRRFEEAGSLSAHEWTKTFGPFDDGGEPIPVERQPLTAALRANRPGHAFHKIRSSDGRDHAIEVSAVPLIGGDNFHGAMIFFWPTDEGET